MDDAQSIRLRPENEVEAKPCLPEANRENGVRSHGVASTRLRGGAASSLLVNSTVNPNKAKTGKIGNYVSPEKLREIFDETVGVAPPYNIGLVDYLTQYEGGVITEVIPNKLSQVDEFRQYRKVLSEKRIVVHKLSDFQERMVIRPSDSSRYFGPGRKQIKAKIYKRLGKWYNCPGLLWTMTYDPKVISKDDAWRNVGSDCAYFLEQLNQWRKREGMPKAKCLRVLEVQPVSGYPHVHMVFPYLRWLAPFEIAHQFWGHGGCRVTVKDQFSPTNYICKYITKLEGWDDESLSQIWKNKTRLYSMSRDYTMPDYSEKRVREWFYVSQMVCHDGVYYSYPDLLPLELEGHPSFPVSVN